MLLSSHPERAILLRIVAMLTKLLERFLGADALG